MKYFSPIYIYVLLIFITACQSPTENAPSTPDAEKQKQLFQLAQRIELSMHQKNADVLDNAFWLEKLYERAVGEMGGIDSSRLEALKKDAAKNARLGQHLLTGLRDRPFSFDLTRLYYEETGAHLVYQFKTEFSYNYLDFELVWSEAEGWRIVDAFNYWDGELFSSSIARFSILLDPKHPQTEVLKLEVLKLSQIDQLLQQGAGDEAMKLYNSISNETKKRGAFSRKKLEIISHTQPELLPQALDEYMNAHKNEPEVVAFFTWLFSQDTAQKQKARLQLDAYVGTAK